MDGHVDITETRQGKTLQRLAAFGERLAELAAERAELAETSEDFKIAVDAFAKVSRGVRMTLALEHRLARESIALQREHRAQRELSTAEAVAARRLQVRNEVGLQILREYEREDIPEVIDDLDDLLSRESKLATFLEEPLDQHIGRLKAFFRMRDDEDLPDNWDDDDEEADDDNEPATEQAPPKPVRWGGPPDDPFILGEVTVLGMDPKPDSS